jgi:hypothetical protein
MPTEEELVLTKQAHDFQPLKELRFLYVHLSPSACLTFLAYAPKFIYKHKGIIELDDPCNYSDSKQSLADLLEETDDDEYHVLVSLTEEIRHLFDEARIRRKASVDDFRAKMTSFKTKIEAKMDEIKDRLTGVVPPQEQHE